MRGERFELVLVITSNADTLLNPTLTLALANSPDQVERRRSSVVSSVGGVVVTEGYDCGAVSFKAGLGVFFPVTCASLWFVW